MHFLLKALLIANISMFITGCLPVIVGAGMVTGGYTALRDKKIGDSLNDSKLDAEIKRRLYKVSPKLFSEVSVVSDQGCILLTGVVSNPEWVSIAEREAWAVNGVEAVDNNITSGEEILPAQVLKDGYITSACRTTLICTAAVRSVNYKLKTMNNVVYVRGVARTDEELNVVLSQLQKVKGVKKVVSYINVTNR
jgi:osmotically-inducible protein OsmY